MLVAENRDYVTAVDTKHVSMGQCAVWLGCTPGFSQELMELAEKCAYEQGFKKVSWIHAGGVITSHGGYGAFSVTGYAK